MKREQKGDLEIFTIEGETDGPTFTALGAIHGYEVCGTKALRRIHQEIENGKICITAGTFIFIPLCNPKAQEEGVRFIGSNMNRFFYPKSDADIETYEHELQNIVCPYLEKTDYVLDLHSYTAEGAPFIYLSGDLNDNKNVAYAKALGIPHMFYGWAEAVASSDDVTDKRHAMGTTEYTREHGGIGFTLECGQHDDPRAPDVGFQAVLNALIHLGMAEIDDDLHITDILKDDPFCIVTKGVQMKMAEGSFTKPWKNGDYVTEGTIIGTYDNGEEVHMPTDGYLIMPKEDNPVGAEWFLWGVEEDLI